MHHAPAPPPNPPYTVLGLVARAAAGKDSCADVLVQTRGFARLAFADALRDEVVTAFAIDPAVLLDRQTKERPIDGLQIRRASDQRFIDRATALGFDLWRPRSPREIMRLYGTEYRRQLDGDNYWIERANERVNTLLASGHRRICFTDVRYPNEGGYITQCLDGELWRIRRSIADKAAATHTSESKIADIACVHTIHNELGLQELAREVHHALVRNILE